MILSHQVRVFEDIPTSDHKTFREYFHIFKIVINLRIVVENVLSKLLLFLFENFYPPLKH